MDIENFLYWLDKNNIELPCCCILCAYGDFSEQTYDTTAEERTKIVAIFNKVTDNQIKNIAIKNYKFLQPRTIFYHQTDIYFIL